MRIEVNPADDRAAFRQIADQIRSAIETGELAEGDRLPTEAAIMASAGVARMTARQGLQVLRNERLVEAEQGRGVFVRRKQPVLRLGADRLVPDQRGPGAGCLAAEADRLGLTLSQELRSVEPVKPAPEIAARLGLRGPAKALARRRLIRLDRTPVQLADSYYPLALVRGTPVAEQDPGPAGVYGALEELGVTLGWAREEVTVRVASAAERALLQLPAGSPVVHLVRSVSDTGGRVVEVLDSVCLPDNFVFTFTTPAG